MSDVKKFFDDLEREIGASPDGDIDEAFVSLALNLAQVRRSRGFTQEDLAQLVGTSQPRIAEIEGGQGNPTLRTLAKLANALEVPIGTLVADRDREYVTVVASAAASEPAAQKWVVKEAAANNNMAMVA